MNFRISNLKNFMENFIGNGVKKRRNVVHKIGYEKISFKKIVRSVKDYVSDENTKRKFKDVGIAVKNLFTKS